MFRRAGFTLIELLIVVTIIAILSGAAIPYVQDYVEDARIAKAKDDIGAIKNALALYETKRSELYASPTAQLLVIRGYLTSVSPDPWGAAYVVVPASGTIFSAGPDGNPGGGDDVIAVYQPPMAVTAAYWLDISGDGSAGVGDTVQVKYTRQALNAPAAATDCLINGGSAGITMVGGAFVDSPNNRVASYGISAGTITPGKTTYTSKPAVVDGNNSACASDGIKILAKY